MRLSCSRCASVLQPLCVCVAAVVRQCCSRYASVAAVVRSGSALLRALRADLLCPICSPGARAEYENRVQMSRRLGLVRGEDMLEEHADFPRGTLRMPFKHEPIRSQR